MGDRDGEMALSGSCAEDEDNVTLIGDEGAGSQLPHRESLTGVSVRSKSSMSLARGSLAMLSW